MKKLALLAVLVLAGCGKKFEMSGTVVDKSFVAASTSVGLSSKGHTKVYYTPDTYTLFVRDTDGKVDSYEVNATKYFALEKGSEVKLDCNSIWGCDVK